jgi:hypothetical protein
MTSAQQDRSATGGFAVLWNIHVIDMGLLFLTGIVQWMRARNARQVVSPREAGMKTKTTLVLAIAASSLAAAAADADTVTTYDSTGGTASYVTISATNLSNGKTITLVNPATSNSEVLLAAGSQVTFDSTLGEVTGFQFNGAMPTELQVTSGALSGLNVNFSALGLTPGTGFTSSSTGSNPYSITLSPVDASGTYTLSGLITNNTPTAVSGATSGITGTITTSGTAALQLTGITLGDISEDGTTIALKGDIVFVGTPVPLPGALWLFAAGLGGLGIPFMRRRRAT